MPYQVNPVFSKNFDDTGAATPSANKLHFEQILQQQQWHCYKRNCKVPIFTAEERKTLNFLYADCLMPFGFDARNLCSRHETNITKEKLQWTADLLFQFGCESLRCRSGPTPFSYRLASTRTCLKPG